MYSNQTLGQYPIHKNVPLCRVGLDTIDNSIAPQIYKQYEKLILRQCEKVR